MPLSFASVDWVAVSGDNSVVFQPGQLAQQLLNAAVAAASVVAALLLIWIVAGWLFRLARLGGGREEYYDYSADNPWSAGDGGIYMPAEFSAFTHDGAPVIAYGAIVEAEASEVTVHSSVGDIHMGRADYDRWFSLVDHEAAQGAEKF